MKIVKRKNYGRAIRSYIFLTVVVVIAAGVYGFFQFQQLSEIQSALAKGQSDLTSLQSAEKRIATAYSEIKNVYDDNFNTIKDTINAVFPSEENYTKLTRLLDAFILDNNNTTLNPIFMSDLRFSKPRIDKENGYSVLPITLTLETTRDNLEKFLEFVENSGSLDTGIRLMDVKSISISFPNEQVSAFETASTGEVGLPTINVSVALNAYFQIPPDSEV